MGFSTEGTLGVSLPNVPFKDFPNLGKALTTGFVIEIVEKKFIRKSIAAHVFTINPSRYTVSEPFQATITPTEANTVIEEVNGIITREITLEGTFGLKERAPKKFAQEMPPMPINQNGKSDGNTQFKHLRDLFRDYSEYKKNPERAPWTKMVFHSLRDDDHWTVVPKVFETPRDAASTRMHYAYRITLLTTGKASSLVEIPTDSFGLDDAFRVVNQALAEARGFVNDINETIGQIKRKIANIDALMLQVDGLLTQIGVAITNSRELVVDYPKKLADSVTQGVVDAANQLAESVSRGERDSDSLRAERSLRKLEIAMHRILSQPTKFKESSQDIRTRIERSYLGERALTDDDFNTGTGGATTGSAQRVASGPESEAGTSFGTYQALRRVEVTALTTLDMLSNTYGVTKELIVLVNGLKPPYFTIGGGNGTLKPGDFVLVPVAQASPSAVVAASDPAYRDVGQTLYGLDFALDSAALENGRLDFAVDTVHGAEDAQYASGVRNVKNGLEIILHTEQGSTQFLPDVGLTMRVGGKGTFDTVLLAATNMRSSILADDRIEGIVSTRVVLSEDVLTQEVTPLLRGSGEGLPVVLPLGRASGG